MTGAGSLSPNPCPSWPFKNRPLTLAPLKTDTEEGDLRAVGAAPRQGWKPEG